MVTPLIITDSNGTKQKPAAAGGACWHIMVIIKIQSNIFIGQAVNPPEMPLKITLRWNIKKYTMALNSYESV